MTTLTTAFAGSPEFAKNILQRLQDSPFAPVVVVTQPDRPKGRGRKLQANPVKTLAQEANIPVLQPINFKAQESIVALGEFKPRRTHCCSLRAYLTPICFGLTKVWVH